MADLPELLDASHVASWLGISLPALRRMSARGDYADLLRVSRGVYRVRRVDHDAWIAERWTSAEKAADDMRAQTMRAAVRGQA